MIESFSSVHISLRDFFGPRQGSSRKVDDITQYITEYNHKNRKTCAYLHEHSKLVLIEHSKNSAYTYFSHLEPLRSSHLLVAATRTFSEAPHLHPDMNVVHAVHAPTCSFNTFILSCNFACSAVPARVLRTASSVSPFIRGVAGPPPRPGLYTCRHRRRFHTPTVPNGGGGSSSSGGGSIFHRHRRPGMTCGSPGGLVRQWRLR